jgi:CrcB protein
VSERLPRREVLALVAVGGLAGTVLRDAVAGLLPGLAGTLAVNVAGSLVLGVVVYERQYAGALAVRTRRVVATGFLSSFTTYSTFALQSALATPELLVANVLATYGLGFAAVLVGRSVARRLTGWSP